MSRARLSVAWERGFSERLSFPGTLAGSSALIVPIIFCHCPRGRNIRHRLETALALG